MKAIEIYDTESVQLIEKKTPVITNNKDVIVKISAVGICGTDVHTFLNEHPFVKPPVVVGHECSGTVAQVGDGVTSLQVGERVVVDPVLGCGTCRPCHTGRPNACANVKCRGVHVEGAMQEFFKVREQDVYRIPDSLSDLVLAAAVEPYAIGAQASWRGNISAGETVVIFGAGPIGLAVMQLAHCHGARCILIDKKPDRLEHALKLGALSVIDAGSQTLAEQILNLTDGEGPEVTCDAVGHPVIVKQCVELVAPTGTVILLGMDGQPNEVTELDIFRKEMTVVGSRMNSGMFASVLKLVEDGSLQMEHLISHRFSADKAEDAFRIAVAQPPGFTKAVIMM